MQAKTYPLSVKVLGRDKMLDAAEINSTFRVKARAVLMDIRGHGLPLVVVEGFRSKVRAALMLATGKSKNGKLSKHCVGRAADMAWFVDGKITWNVPSAWWLLYMHSAEVHGLTAGGRWKMRDTNHIELG